MPIIIIDSFIHEISENSKNIVQRVFGLLVLPCFNSLLSNMTKKIITSERLVKPHLCPLCLKSE